MLLSLLALVSCGFKGCGIINEDTTTQGDEAKNDILAGWKLIEESLIGVEEEYLDENGFVSLENAPVFIDDIYEIIKDSDQITYCEKNDFNVLVILNNGVHCIYEAPVESLANFGDEVAIYTYQPFYDDFILETALPLKYGKAPSEAVEELEKLDITVSTAERLYNGDVTIEAVKNLKGNSVIVWVGHGAYTKEDHSVLMLTVKHTKEIADKYEKDFTEGCLVYSNNSNNVGVTYKFFEKHLSDDVLNNSIIYLGTCNSGTDDILVETLRKKGATTIYVNTNATYQRYNNRMCKTIIESLCDGSTVEESLVVAQGKHGEVDIVSILYNTKQLDLFSEVKCVGDKDFTLHQLHQNIAIDKILGVYDGSYTAPQGLMGMTLSIYRTKDLLSDDILLQKYADVATNCGSSTNNAEKVIFTVEDVKSIISQHTDEYIALFNYFPVVDEETGIAPNPDVEEGLYAMSVNYNSSTKHYEFIAKQWIQHDTYTFADLKNVVFSDGIMSGDIYGENGLGIFAQYMDLGDFTVSCVNDQTGYRIDFEREEVSLNINETLDIKVFVKNHQGLLASDNANIKWFSKDENIVTISGENWGNNNFEYALGSIVGVGKGVTEIYAELDNTRIVSCSVEVKSPTFNLNKDGESYCVTGIGTWTDTDLVIPDTYKGLPVTNCCEYAFRGCLSFTSATIPNSMDNIAKGLFRSCYSLISVTIPDSVTIISAYAFDQCTGLSTINIPNSVVRIDYSAFNGCSSLTSIEIPDSVTRIDAYAFSNCISLTSITFEGTVEQWNAIYHGNCWHNNTPATEVKCSNGTVPLN